jgi:stage IV sporulation protein A
MDKFDIYKDIAVRTEGDIYVGVVGPVRTGKSTFIKKFMEKVVIDKIEDVNKRQRTIDELPQSADGKTIMTSQPKFVPNEAVRITFKDNISANIRLIDCVGYLVDGAIGSREGEKERLVLTPWSNEEMPFEKAAEIGTQKVITSHSTIGVLLTTDGSITDIERHKYVEAEERSVKELKALGKPFAIILNSKSPNSEETQKLRDSLIEKYGQPVINLDVLNMTPEDIDNIFENVLLEFPLKLIDVSTPMWMQALNLDSSIVRELTSRLMKASKEMTKMRDFIKLKEIFDGAEYLDKAENIQLDMGKGRVSVDISLKADLFYSILSEECGDKIDNDFKLLRYVTHLRDAEKQYKKLKNALVEVKEVGYGVVSPSVAEMVLEEPVMVRQGGQYGIKFKAQAPSLHIMRVDVETEVSPIVGTEQQSEELVKSLMSQFENDKKAIWETPIFGKTLNNLVNEELNNKVIAMPE